MSALLGAAIGLLFWLSDRDEPFWGQIVGSAWIGMWIYAWSQSLMVLFWPLMSRLQRGPLVALLTGLFFAAGALGWACALLTVGLPLVLVPGASGRGFGLLRHSGALVGGLGFAGAIGAIVGLLFYRYEMLQERLRDSLRQLQRRELAEQQLETAREIQHRILPPPRIAGDGYTIAARNLAAQTVAGDFYDVFRRGDGTVGVVVADVAGKGLGASLIMASVKAKLPLFAAERSVAQTLDALNENLLSELGPREFVALCFLVYDPETGDFEIGNAGLPDPYLVGESLRPVETPGERLPLGMRSGTHYETFGGHLGEDEMLFLFTDGLPEATLGSSGEPLGYAGLEALLGGEPLKDPLAWVGQIFDRAQERTRHQLEDDWTALVLRRESLRGVNEPHATGVAETTA